MKFSVLLIPLLFIFFEGTAQRNKPPVVDTVDGKNGTVILFSNQTWEYLEEEPVMMSPEDDSTGLFTSEWINDQVFSYPGACDSIKDTLIVLAFAGHPFTMPRYGRLFRGFTYSHKGLDISLCRGDSVKAAFDGVVRYSKYNRGGFGNLVILRHYNGIETYYAHLTKSLVQVNQVVSSGDYIGLGGSTGRSRAPHLHFEVRFKDHPLDPLRMIDFDNQKLVSDTFLITKKVFCPNDYNENAVYYKIRSGDTLGRIAGKYHTSVKELCAMNKIKPTTTLRIGRTIRVK